MFAKKPQLKDWKINWNFHHFNTKMNFAKVIFLVKQIRVALYKSALFNFVKTWQHSKTFSIETDDSPLFWGGNAKKSIEIKNVGWACGDGIKLLNNSVPF